MSPKRHPAIAWRSALLDVNDVPSTARLVGVAMAEHASTTGELWPSLARLAVRTGLSDRSVRTQIRVLEDKGWLARTRSGGTVGGNRTSQWRLLTPERPSGVDDGPTPEPPSTTPEPPSVTPEPRSADPGTSFPLTREELERTREEPLVASDEKPSSTATAKTILDTWWNTQNPKPAAPYPAALKVLTRALDRGWEPDDLERAITEIPVISGGALDYWRNSNAFTSQLVNGTSTDDLAAGVTERVNRAMGVNA